MKTAAQIQTELNNEIAALLSLAPKGETETERAARQSTAAERAAAVRISLLRAKLALAQSEITRAANSAATKVYNSLYNPFRK